MFRLDSRILAPYYKYSYTCSMTRDLPSAALSAVCAALNSAGESSISPLSGNVFGPPPFHRPLPRGSLLLSIPSPPMSHYWSSLWLCRVMCPSSHDLHRQHHIPSRTVVLGAALLFGLSVVRLH